MGDGLWIKVHEKLLSEPWFLSLGIGARGFIIQLWLLAVRSSEKSGKNPVVFTRGDQHLAQIMGCDGKTARKYLGYFRGVGKIEVSRTEDGLLRIVVLKFYKYQSHIVGGDDKNVSELSGKNPAKLPLRIRGEEKRLDKKERKKEISDFADWLMSQYNETCALPKCKIINPDRLEKIEARTKDLGELHSEKWWINSLEYLRDCTFFHGDNTRGWIMPGFDWMLKKSNFIKIWEKVYELGDKKTNIGSHDYGAGGLR